MDSRARPTGNGFSAPWIYKKYVDEIINAGLAWEDFLFLHFTSDYKFKGFDIQPDIGVFHVFQHADIPCALRPTGFTSSSTACRPAGDDGWN